MCPCSLCTAHSTSSSLGTELSIWEGIMDVGIFPPGVVTAQYSSMHSTMIHFSVTQAGGGAWSTAALYHPHILLHDLRRRERSPIKIRSMFLSDVSTRRRLSAFSSARIALPIHLNHVWNLPGSCLTETLSSMSLYVSAVIRKL